MFRTISTGDLGHRLVPGPAAGALAEVGGDQRDPVGGPGRTGVGVEQPHPVRHLGGSSEPGHGDVRPESLAVDRDAGPRRRRPGTGRQPVQLGRALVVEVEAGPHHPRPAGVGEGSAAGDPGLERRTPLAGPLQPLDQLVEVPVGHRGEEGEGDVELLGQRPAEGAGLPPGLEESVEVLDRLAGAGRGRRTSASRGEASPDLGAEQGTDAVGDRHREQPPPTLRATARPAAP